MLETFFEAPFTLNHLRTSPLGNYIGGFAQTLSEQRYAIATTRRFLRASNVADCLIATLKKNEKLLLWGANSTNSAYT